MSIDGPTDLEHFRKFDGDDIFEMRRGAVLAEAFFRITGEKVSEERDAKDDADVDAGDRTDGAGAPGRAHEPAE